jgi:hypothetical protein
VSKLRHRNTERGDSHGREQTMKARQDLAAARSAVSTPGLVEHERAGGVYPRKVNALVAECDG